MSILYIILLFLIFIMIYSVIYVTSEKERRQEKNLNLLSIHTPDDEEELVDEENWLYKLYDKYYNTKFIQANLRITYGEFKTYSMAAAVVFGIILITVSFMFSVIFAFMFAGIIVFFFLKIPDFIIDNKKYKRKMALNAQKGDILSIMSSCSSSQMPLDKTFYTLSERLSEPASSVFSEAYSLMRVGNPPEEVLHHLKKVFDSNDFNFLLSSYEVWLENNGSLQDTYRIVSIAIRDKEEIDLHMAGLESKTKTTLFVLAGISILFAVLSLCLISDIFIPFAKSLTGQIAILASFLIFGYGASSMNKLKNSIKY